MLIRISVVEAIFLVVGCALQWSVSSSTEPKQPSVVRTLTALSNVSFFSNSRLKVSWIRPSSAETDLETNNEILFYEVTLRSSTVGHCIKIWIIKCVDCVLRSKSSMRRRAHNCIGPKFAPVAIGNFNKSQTHLSLKLNDCVILPDNNYTVDVQPINLWGWGPAVHVLVVTAKFGRQLTIASVTSASKEVKMKLMWNHLCYDCGVVYLVVLKSNDSRTCVAVWRVTCSDCSKQNSKICEIIPPDCRGIRPESATYNLKDALCLLTTNIDIVRPETNYSVSVLVTGKFLDRNYASNFTTGKWKEQWKIFDMLQSTKGIVVSVSSSVVLLLFIVIAIACVKRNKTQIIMLENQYEENQYTIPTIVGPMPINPRLSYGVERDQPYNCLLDDYDVAQGAYEMRATVGESLHKPRNTLTPQCRFPPSSTRHLTASSTSQGPYEIIEGSCIAINETPSSRDPNAEIKDTCEPLETSLSIQGPYELMQEPYIN